MWVPAALDAAVGNPDWQVFAVFSGLTLFVCAALTPTCRTDRFRMSVRQAFVMTTMSWGALTLFASLPFMFSELGMSFTDSFFEAMSGITTTGSTVIIGLDAAPPGIRLWRGILHWLGGLGIIVMAISVMPMLGVGGMQMFRVEAFETGEKIMPRAAQISAMLSLIYTGLTIILVMALWLAGMTGLEAVVHTMTTIATGGYSTLDASVGGFDSALIDVIITVGMVLAGLPFVLYLRTLQGYPRDLFQDLQVRWYLAILAAATLVTALFLWREAGFDALSSLRYAAFNIVSTMTGTGFVTADYGLWGGFAGPNFFYVMFIGGCTGSTTCGIKIFRFQVLWAAANTQFHHMVRPHGVSIP